MEALRRDIMGAPGVDTLLARSVEAMRERGPAASRPGVQAVAASEDAIMNILVTGGTGTVGSQVVRELLARGAQVQVLTRDASKAAKLPAGVKAVTGDLSRSRGQARIQGRRRRLPDQYRSPTEVYEGLLSVCALARGERQAIRLCVGPERRCAPRGCRTSAASSALKKPCSKSGKAFNDPPAEQLLSERLLVQGRHAAARRLSAADRQTSG